MKPNFRALGGRFGKGTPPVAAAIEAADPRPPGRWTCGRAARRSVVVDGPPVSLGPEDVIVTQVPRSGWAVAAEGGETVALDVAITPELRREGLAREVSGWSRTRARPTAWTSATGSRCAGARPTRTWPPR